MYISLRIALEILNYWSSRQRTVLPTLIITITIIIKFKIKENSYRTVPAELPASILSHYFIPSIPEEKFVFEDKGKDQKHADKIDKTTKN